MEMTWIPMVGYGAVGLLLLGWLAVSFMAPGAKRAVIEWSSATAMFVALLSLFANLLVRSIESGNGHSQGRIRALGGVIEDKTCCQLNRDNRDRSQ